jgi:hypothetical protein
MFCGAGSVGTKDAEPALKNAVSLVCLAIFGPMQGGQVLFNLWLQSIPWLHN